MKPAALPATGAVLWVLALLWLRPALLIALLLLGPFVVVALAFGLVGPLRPGARWASAWRALRILQLPAAAAVAVSFHEPEGMVAAAWTLPWLAFAGLLALAALVRATGHGWRPIGELSIDAGLAFVAVGAMWLTVSRSGLTVLGFGNPIALLTAAHFNLAGIAVPVLAGLAARRLPGSLAAWSCFGAISGLPVVAAGITLHAQGVHVVNSLAVDYFAAAMMLLVAQHARLALRPGSPAVRLLFGLSAATLPVGMALAVLYAASELTGHVISIDTMVHTHAVLNAFGFAVAALLAWWATPVPESAASPVPAAASA